MHQDWLKPAFPLPILADQRVAEVYTAALQVMERIGVAFHNKRALANLSDAGADVSNRGRVRIPSYAVEQAIRKAPEAITIYSRDGDHARCSTG